ncbi:MAG: MXAN_5808 family serine peptidase [Myxococcota bacterium]
MKRRLLALAILSAVMVYLGREASVHRASLMSPPGEVLAFTGTEPGFLSAEGPAATENYRISALSVFSNVALHVKDNYVDPSRINPKEMLMASLAEIERQVAEVLVEDLGDGRVRISVPDQQKIITVNDVESLWEINLKLREVFRFFEKYLPPQKDVRAVEYAAVNGALSTLDPHSVLLKPDAFSDMKTQTKGEFGGLGIVISIREGKLTIMTPLEGTPATRAGLKALDVITRIGDISTVSMPIEEAVAKLRGVVGSKVTIWVQRKGWPEAKKYVLTRENIKIESVEGRLLDDRIGYVRIKNFQQNTGHDLDEKIEKLEREAKAPLKGIVLDLRNNPGGLLEQAIRVSDKFLSSGDIVTTVGYGNKLREPKRAQWSGSDVDYPVAVLVNNGSASASEIVAGALRNLDRAVIIGEQSFGKGSVQVLYEFGDNLALKLTIAQYLTPGGISIQNVGVAPDIELRPALIEKDSVHLYYTPESHREASLDKHLDRQRPESDEPEQKPTYSLTYLVEQEKKEEPAHDDPDDESAPPDNFREDYPIKVAKKVLAGAGKTKRSETLGLAKRIMEEKQAEEQAHITEAITKLGLDWTAAPPVEKPAILVDLKWVGAPDGKIPAGGEVTIEATVKNQSPRAVGRVHATLDSEHPSLRGRELLFGTLAPGASKTASLQVRIPKDSPTRTDVVSLKLAAQDAPLESDAKLMLTTIAVPSSSFAYSYVIDDSEHGDGDGILEKGEEVDFVVLVTNVGKADVEKARVRLKSGAGEELFLEQGLVENLAIPVGETRLARLKFKVRAEVSEKTSLPVELTIYDAAGGNGWIEDEISLTAAPLDQEKAQKKKLSGVTTKDIPLYAAAREDAQILGILPKGSPLNSTARVDGFARVELLGEPVAFIHADELKPGRGPKKALAQLWPSRRTPEIKVDGDLGNRVVDTAEINLSGAITARSLKDMYVTLNDKKVFFTVPAKEEKRPATTSSDPLTPPKDDAVRLPFQKLLTLKDGINKVQVVARVDERVLSVSTVYVTKHSKLEPAVAEARKEEKLSHEVPVLRAPN